VLTQGDDPRAARIDQPSSSPGEDVPGPPPGLSPDADAHASAAIETRWTSRQIAGPSRGGPPDGERGRPREHGRAVGQREHHARGHAAPTRIRIYLNGEMVGRVAASLGRQDVLSAHPEFGTADVGWRFNLKFPGLPHGLHRIDVLAENEAGGLVKLGTRQFAYVDRKQSAAQPVPAVALPDTVAADASLAASIDAPANLTPVFFNPLVPLWHEFRGRQLVRYLAFIASRLNGSCLAGVDSYVHQIAPFTNPSWDSTKYAVEASLRPSERLRLGISLYGESTYGDSFFDWYRRDSEQTQYGITEFHPLRAMDADELRRTFDRHRAHGARFLSFFVDGTPRRPVPAEQSVFVYTVFSPDIPAFGSDRLFAAVRVLMSQ